MGSYLCWALKWSHLFKFFGSFGGGQKLPLFPFHWLRHCNGCTVLLLIWNIYVSADNAQGRSPLLNSEVTQVSNSDKSTHRSQSLSIQPTPPKRARSRSPSLASVAKHVSESQLASQLTWSPSQQSTQVERTFGRSPTLASEVTYGPNSDSESYQSRSSSSQPSPPKRARSRSPWLASEVTRVSETDSESQCSVSPSLRAAKAHHMAGLMQSTRTDRQVTWSEAHSQTSSTFTSITPL